MVFKIFLFISLLPLNPIITSSDYEYWNDVMEAIIQVESNGNPNAVNKTSGAVGAMQIKKIVVDDCNEYLAKKKINKRYTYDDRWNVQKSKEMFMLIQDRYNKNKDIEKAARIWNGGCCYNKEKTDGYYKKFLIEYSEIQSKAI